MADVLAHQAFRAVLMALASPGRPQRLPVADRDQALDLVLEAIWGEVPGRVRVAAGHDAVAAIESAPRGSEAEPEAGMTIVRLVDAGQRRTPVVLEGPGVDGRLEVELPLSAAELEARQRACAGYPLGVDLVLLDGGGFVVGLPRSTRVAALARPE